MAAASGVRGVPIEVRGVSHTYRRNGAAVTALSGIDLSVAAGQFVAVLGPSGCGKTTLLLAIGGLLTPSAGVVTVADTAVHQPYPDIGVVFQDPTLLAWRTTLKNVLLPAEVRRLDKRAARDRAMALLEAAKLENFADAYPAELSGGMRQRVAICRALLPAPALLLMDEPFGALDALTREQMMIDLQRLWLMDRQTVVFVTHSITEAIFLADRVVVMSPRPGRVLDILPVELPRPRHLADMHEPAFQGITAKIMDLLRGEGLLDETR